MTEKVYSDDGPKLSVLIIPVAAAIVLIARAWPLLVLTISTLVAWKVYDKIQWMRQCDRYNPAFNQLIKENQGCLTALDFSNETSLREGPAKKFLERKAEEYGAVKKNIGTQGTLYYFITASALGSIFDESEQEEQPLAAPSSNVLAELAQLKKSEPQISQDEHQLVPVEISEVSLPENIDQSVEVTEELLQLIQSELAKRLDINSATITKRRLEPDFTEWSQSKDPDGIAWVYVPDAKIFIPKVS